MIGLEALRKIVYHPLFDGIPKFLETPGEDESENLKEIEMFKKCCD